MNLARLAIYCAFLVIIGTWTYPPALSDDAPWRLAVVFTVSSTGSRIYLGTAPGLAMLAPLVPEVEAPLTTCPKCEPTHEVWLCRDGRMVGLWYSTRTSQGGLIRYDGSYQTSTMNMTCIEPIIRASAPPRPLANRAPHPGGNIPEFETYRCLYDMIEKSDHIVTGRVVGMLRMAHTPINAIGMEQHTVFVLAVERPIKRAKPLQQHAYLAPPLIKMYQRGGYLDWSELGLRGTGFIDNRSPILVIGERYLLFADNIIEELPRDRASIDVIEPNSKVGIDAYLDEYTLLQGYQGAILLKVGKALVPPGSGYPDAVHDRAVHLGESDSKIVHLVNTTETASVGTVVKYVGKQSNYAP